MNKEELLESLKCYISTIDETIKVNLVSYIEDEGLEATEDLLQYLYNNIKTLKGIKRAGHIIKFIGDEKVEIIKCIIVYR
jgi:hypothetical protein